MLTHLLALLMARLFGPRPKKGPHPDPVVNDWIRDLQTRITRAGGCLVNPPENALTIARNFPGLFIVAPDTSISLNPNPAK